MKDQYLIIGIVIAFGVGFMAGAMRGSSPGTLQAPAPAIPSNYDPARTVCLDALKMQKESTDACYRGWLEIRPTRKKHD